MPVTTEPTLRDRVAVLTGAVRRSGRAVALALVEDGATVVINTRASRSEADALAQEIRARGGRVLVHIADITREAEVETMFQRIDAELGRVDILVNNAADRQQVPFLQMSYAQWRHITSIILDGAFLCSRAALERMATGGFGRIVNLSGIGHHLGFRERAHVHAGKAGLEGLSRALALEFAGHDITVNCVAPGKIGGVRPASAGTTPPGVAEVVPPVGRDGIPADVAAAVRFLCQPSSSFITGQTVHVNGGMFLT
ncbi:MAG: SDR family oxidoreductase [Gammaproteobacteria bacterium]|nr:SDR family oxidoreductase [Gammaproteobacteria bacterium]